MSDNSYGNLLKPWQVKLIAKRARRFGFRDDELPDLEQRIVPKLICAQFHKNGSAGATTFSIRIIDRQLSSVLRDRKRSVRRINAEALPLEIASENSLAIVDGIEHLCLKMDLQDALIRLTSEERYICISLQRGDSQTDIARALRKSSPTIYEKTKSMALKFRLWGLDAYLNK